MFPRRVRLLGPLSVKIYSPLVFAPFIENLKFSMMRIQRIMISFRIGIDTSTILF